MELHSITLPAAQIVENIKHTFPSSPYFPQELACYGACIVPEHKSHPLHLELLNVSPSTGRSIYSFPHLDQNPSVNPVSMHPVNSEYAYLPSKKTEFLTLGTDHLNFDTPPPPTHAKKKVIQKVEEQEKNGREAFIQVNAIITDDLISICQTQKLQT